MTKPAAEVLYCRQWATPVGRLLALVDENGTLHRLVFVDEDEDARALATRAAGRPCLWTDARSEAVVQQLGEYFDGRRRWFELPLAAARTDFQRQVRTELQRIPWGEVATYSDLAARLDRPTAVRAVARANAVNPLPIVVPCHRVIGADGSLTGYGGGLRVKQALLELEGAWPLQSALRQARLF